VDICETERSPGAGGSLTNLTMILPSLEDLSDSTDNGNLSMIFVQY
jgi:hypothetical protein